MAIVGWSLLSLLTVIVLLLILPIGVKIEYLHTWKVRVLLFGFIPVWTMTGDRIDAPNEPDIPKVEGPPSDDKKEEKPSLAEQLKSFYKQEGLKGVMSLFKTLINIVNTTLRRVAHSITIDELQLCVRVGGEQADKTAVRYGQVCSALFPLITTLSSAIRIRRPIVRVQPDFLSDGMDVRLRMKMYICPLGIVAAGLTALLKLMGVWSTVTAVSQSESQTPTTSESQKI